MTLAREKLESSVPTLDLGLLSKGMPPGVSPIVGAFAGEAAAVSFSANGHESGVPLPISGIVEDSRNTIWQLDETIDYDRAWGDHDIAVEYGACGIAFLLSQLYTDYLVIEKVYKGGGFDYWLGYDNDDIFENAARLEVSGIFRNPKAVDSRVAQKLRQTDPSDEEGPAFVAVVEFSEPRARFEKKHV